jgi:hypothetical protein
MTALKVWYCPERSGIGKTADKKAGILRGGHCFISNALMSC